MPRRWSTARPLPDPSGEHREHDQRLHPQAGPCETGVVSTVSLPVARAYQWRRWRVPTRAVLQAWAQARWVVTHRGRRGTTAAPPVQVSLSSPQSPGFGGLATLVTLTQVLSPSSVGEGTLTVFPVEQADGDSERSAPR